MTPTPPHPPPPPIPTSSPSLPSIDVAENFQPDEDLAGGVQGAEGGDGAEGRANNELRQGVGALMDAMRDLLNNIRMAPPPVENGQDQEGEGGQEDREELDEWD